MSIAGLFSWLPVFGMLFVLTQTDFYTEDGGALETNCADDGKCPL